MSWAGHGRLRAAFLSCPQDTGEFTRSAAAGAHLCWGRSSSKNFQSRECFCSSILPISLLLMFVTAPPSECGGIYVTAVVWKDPLMAIADLLKRVRPKTGLCLPRALLSPPCARVRVPVWVTLLCGHISVHPAGWRDSVPQGCRQVSGGIC